MRTNSYRVIPTNVHNIGGTDEKTVLNYYYEHGGLTGKGKDGVLCYFLGANGGKGDSERCGIMKYYIAKSQNDLLNRNETCYKIEDSIVSQALPMQRDYKNLRDYVQFVGDYAYVNASFHVKNMFPNHGICGVLIVKDFDKFIPLSSANVSPQFSEFNTTAICNIKRNIVPYGGNSYINRQTSVYQSCGAMVKNDEYIKKIHCWGGDTYLCVFDYQNTVIA